MPRLPKLAKTHCFFNSGQSSQKQPKEIVFNKFSNNTHCLRQVQQHLPKTTKNPPLSLKLGKIAKVQPKQTVFDNLSHIYQTRKNTFSIYMGKSCQKQPKQTGFYKFGNICPYKQRHFVFINLRHICQNKEKHAVFIQFG